MTLCRQCKDAYHVERDGPLDPLTGDCLHCQLDDAQATIVTLEARHADLWVCLTMCRAILHDPEADEAEIQKILERTRTDDAPSPVALFAAHARFRNWVKSTAPVDWHKESLLAQQRLGEVQIRCTELLNEARSLRRALLEANIHGHRPQ